MIENEITFIKNKDFQVGAVRTSIKPMTQIVMQMSKHGSEH
jgi:hypothetical protein